jgi:alpha-glucuronidase
VSLPVLRLVQLTFLSASVLLPTAVAQEVGAAAVLGSGDPAWLSFKLVESAIVFPGGIPDTIVELGNSVLEDSAAKELAAGWRGMLQHQPRVVRVESSGRRGEVVLGTQAEINAWRPHATPTVSLKHDGYRLYVDKNALVIEGGDDRGVLYGTFSLLREIAEQHSLAKLDEGSAPWAAIRWTNEWDNPNGTIERGYAGPSIFFEDGRVRADLSRAAAYARLLSSVGIDGCTINNVNADLNLLRPENLRDIARIADVFRPYGVRLSLSVDMSSPQVIGSLKTFRPSRSGGCRLVEDEGG